MLPPRWPRAAVWVFVTLGVIALLSGCGGAPEAGAEMPRLVLDEADPERLLRAYLGGYVAPDGGDPFEAGLVLRQGEQLLLDTTALRGRLPAGAAMPVDADADGALVWDELAPFLVATYAAVRPFPETLAAFQNEVSYRDTSAAWFQVRLHGVMTQALRTLYVPEAALRSALTGYEAAGQRLLYPVGTTIVGEHHEAEALRETTVMRKRGDGFWDFFAYGPDGQLLRETVTGPRALSIPTQCMGCHLGNRPFEPERSFPAAARPGPHGPRSLYVDDALRDAEVTAFFQEHRKRSDTVLGLYSTLFVAELRARRAAGTLPPDDAALLDALGL